jgi:hypothetical protein
MQLCNILMFSTIPFPNDSICNNFAFLTKSNKIGLVNICIINIISLIYFIFKSTCICSSDNSQFSGYSNGRL